MPVLAIAAQVPSSEIGSHYFQETRPEALFRECRHYCETISHDNPFDVGMTGLLGFSSGYHAIMNADVLLMLGTEFPYQDFYLKQATIVQIDIRGEQLGRCILNISRRY